MPRRPKQGPGPDCTRRCTQDKKTALDPKSSKSFNRVSETAAGLIRFPKHDVLRNLHRGMLLGCSGNRQQFIVQQVGAPRAPIPQVSTGTWGKCAALQMTTPDPVFIQVPLHPRSRSREVRPGCTCAQGPTSPQRLSAQGRLPLFCSLLLSANALLDRKLLGAGFYLPCALWGAVAIISHTFAIYICCRVCYRYSDTHPGILSPTKGNWATFGVEHSSSSTAHRKATPLFS